MNVISVLFQWVGVVFLVGTVILYVREQRKLLPTKEEKDFLIKCRAISPDEKKKKVLREATRQYRMTSYVLGQLELDGQEILELNKQAQERKKRKLAEVQKPVNLDKTSGVK